MSIMVSGRLLKTSFLAVALMLLALAFFVFVKIGFSAPAPLRVSFDGEVISTAPAYKAMLFAPFLATLFYFFIRLCHQKRKLVGHAIPTHQ